MITKKRLLVVISLALVTGGCARSGDVASLQAVAQAAARQADRVQVVELAEWLVEGRQDFLLIDIRSAADFEKGHIGEAQNIPITQLVTNDSLASLPTDRKIIVYSNGSENGAKAATLLRIAGMDAHVVTGGYNAWHQRILNPDIPLEELDGESRQVSAQRAFSCYFVGDRGAGASERPKVEFVPPVFTEDEAEELEPLPPVGEESC